MTNFLLKKALQGLLGSYGDVRHVDLASKSKQATLHFAPKGESFVLEVQIQGVELRKNGSQDELHFERLVCNREWAQELIKNFAKSPIPVSPAVAIWLRMFL